MGDLLSNRGASRLLDLPEGSKGMGDFRDGNQYKLALTEAKQDIVSESYQLIAFSDQLAISYQLPRRQRHEEKVV